MILICYDGSIDSRSAIEHAGELLKGQPATILTVWEPFVQLMTRTSYGFGLSPGMVDVEEIDTSNREGAEQRAKEGVELARQAGLEAESVVRPEVTTVANTILREAAAVGANAIVMGSRGLTGVKSVLLGSVSHGVVQHADRPVIVVPSPEVAAVRERSLRAEEDT